MATRGQKLNDSDRRYIERRIRDGASIYRTAREALVSENTVRKILRENLLTNEGKPAA